MRAPAPHTFELAIKAMRGTLLRAGTRGGAFAGIAYDSRTTAAGQLFFALPGERVDGFAFAAQAAAAGAMGVVVARARGVPPGCDGLTVIGVDDPRLAMGDLARAVRASFRGQVVGITGSMGKTTTKELAAAALRTLGDVLRTPGSLNTEIGLPVTVLSASGREAAWVLEMAMRGRGEIAYLADIARPNVGVITNVSGAHLERLGSIEEIARAKGELFAGLAHDGVAILPADDPLIAAEVERVAPERRITFEGAARARLPVDVRLLEVLPAGVAGSVVRYAVRGTPVVVRLPLGGAHNARNGAAALAVALAVGAPTVEAARALETLELPPHRSAIVPAAGRVVLDDCYNANPDAMRAALASVVASAGPARAFAILGDMLELGPAAEELHAAVGRDAGARLAGLVAVGAHAETVVAGARAAGLAAARAVAAASPEEAAARVAAWTSPGDWVLVKASRGMKLERAVAALVAALQPDAPDSRHSPPFPHSPSAGRG
ncbi:MAG TPA: UDP-N-acetylmuramoyl-tripeptide--D-alanyl-D-alanine ligase [Polyangia bacterium]|nr:UDP-N-acetylmuramoyl-tripeptide--D-alanyl-D-alanine ligase [Polyangia bacterium]